MYSLYPSENKKYIIVCVKEPMTRKLAIDLAREGDLVAKKYAVTSFLYDLRESINQEKPIENYKFTYSDTSDLKIERNVKVALVTSYGDDSHDFIVLMSKNAGFIMEQFKDIEAAINWLERAN